VHAPLIHMSKADIVREGLRLDVDFAQTVSCYQADARRPRLRPLRRLPPARRGLRGRRRGRPTRYV
jgi:7-cyano-7-deazaguanine synthase